MGNCVIKRSTDLTTVHKFVSSVESIYTQWQKQELPIDTAKQAIEDQFETISHYLIDKSNLPCTSGSNRSPPQVFLVTTSNDILIVTCSLVVAVMNGGTRALHVGFTLTPHPSDNNVEPSARHKPLIQISTDKSFSFKKDPTPRDASRVHNSFTPVEDLILGLEGDDIDSDGGGCSCRHRDCHRNRNRHCARKHY